MDIFTAFSYIAGRIPANPGPLARFLPPLEDGAAAAWLADHTQPGDWVLDPFGASPRLTVEAARAGCRVLVSANNPVTRFLLEMAADPPAESELKAGLAELAVARKGEERLEAHLQARYLTDCAKCGRAIPAQAFIWRREADAPYARIYRCPHCKDEGERLVTPADNERAAEIAATAGLHRARVLERVTALDDAEREYAEESLSYYLPRAIYVLGTLINKLDGLPLSARHRRRLTALLLTACDQANTLWLFPTERPRPRQLIIPAQFREHNVWMALEESISLWAGDAPPVLLVLWPHKLPESGGICLYEGRLRDLVTHLKDAPIRAVLGAFPRPNQAFWTLSALWAGWLWGREAVAPFKSVLRRRRYDWGWHATALHAVLRHLFVVLTPGTPFFGLLAEAEPAFVSGILTAASAAGFDLQGIALRTVHDPLQIVWQRRAQLGQPSSEAGIGKVQAAVRAFLDERGEPAMYLYLHTAALAALAKERALARPRLPLDESLTHVQTTIQKALSRDEQLQRYDGSEQSLEAGLWDVRDKKNEIDPLPDRVEMALVRFLQQNLVCTRYEIERNLYPQFPGLFTPPLALLLAVLDSYARQENGRWKLRDEDAAAARRADLETATALVEAIGGRLNYAARRREPNSVHWEEDKAPAYAFYVLPSAVIGRILRENPHPPERSLIVVPGGRAGLVAYKLRRDPYLRQKAQGWRFLKFRHLRQLAEIPILTRQTWEEQLISDPIEQARGQMMMF